MGTKEYFWVVRCKNHRFHNRENIFFGHQIPLAETDAFLPPPVLNDRLLVRCDSCGKENIYDPKEILRAEIDPPTGFTPHPMCS